MHYAPRCTSWVSMDEVLRSLLDPFDPEVLDRDPCTVYVVDGDLRIRFVNTAWAGFAREHGAPWDARVGGAWGVGVGFGDGVGGDGFG